MQQTSRLLQRPRAAERACRTPKPKTHMAVQCDMDINDSALRTRHWHRMHAPTMLRPKRSNEHVRSTLLPERADARPQHAEKRPRAIIHPCVRLQRKERLLHPSVGARFLAEKVPPGKCVFRSVGLRIFGRFSGPGKPGPRKGRRRTGARESPDARAAKKGTRQCRRRPTTRLCGFFAKP